MREAGQRFWASITLLGGHQLISKIGGAIYKRTICKALDEVDSVKGTCSLLRENRQNYSIFVNWRLLSKGLATGLNIEQNLWIMVWNDFKKKQKRNTTKLYLKKYMCLKPDGPGTVIKFWSIVETSSSVKPVF